MNSFLTAAGIAGAAVAAGAVGATAGAVTLFNRVIPRQNEIKVDISEMADMEKWEEYKKIIHPNKEWLMQRKMEHITIKSKDGLTLHGDYVTADSPSDKLAITFHGYTGSGLSDCASISTYFLKQGYDCLIVDNRAHGKSEGDYIGFGILDRYDCLSWIRYAENHFGNDKKIVLYGVSMGAATVLMASGFLQFPESVKAIIADCAFTSPFDVFAHILKRDYHLPPFPIMNITDNMCRQKAGYGFSEYSTLTAMKSARCPILFIHGMEDNFVPTWMTRKNFEACNSPKELLLVPNAGHAASYYENVSLYEDAVTNFLNQFMP